MQCHTYTASSARLLVSNSCNATTDHLRALSVPCHLGTVPVPDIGPAPWHLMPDRCGIKCLILMYTDSFNTPLA
jgi:hypothetical protein